MIALMGIRLGVASSQSSTVSVCAPANELPYSGLDASYFHDETHGCDAVGHSVKVLENGISSYFHWPSEERWISIYERMIDASKRSMRKKCSDRAALRRKTSTWARKGRDDLEHHHSSEHFD